MEIVKIVNMLQVSKYVKGGVQPIRIELGENDRLVFVFRKEDTTEIWEKWKNHELD